MTTLTAPTPAAVLVGLRGLPFALLAALTSWISVVSWHGMVEDPVSRVLRPLLVVGVLLAVVGWAVRRRTNAGWAFGVQLLVLAEWLLVTTAGTPLPTPGALGYVRDELVSGATAGQRYVSPVSSQHPEFATLLLLSALGILLAVDLVACGLRHAALAGLPLLLSITISASVLLSPVSWLVFALTAAGWLSLIARQESGRLGSWESTSGGTSSPVDPVDRGGRGGPDLRLPALIPGLSPTGGLAGRIAAVCVGVAVLLTAGITSQGRQLGDFGGGNGNGTLSATNPILDMRRNLRESRDVPLVSVTSREVPTYLRLTSLDDFTADAWRPGSHTFDNTVAVAGSLPPPAGLSPLNQGTASTWRIKVATSFPTRWLPAPFITSVLDVTGKWRYSPGTFDIISGGDDTAAGLSYSLSTYQPVVDPATLRIAAPAPAAIARTMTEVPDNLPAVFGQVARQVTAGANNDYDRAVALQSWFRDSGGFTYSTKPASGTGIGTLERFITDDKVGYCEQFSAAMAVMARTLGIPARISVGFLRPQKTGRSTYTFGSRDLHAWPELYFAGVGWIRFEPTPAARTGNPPSYTAPQAVPSSLPSVSASAAPTAQPRQAKPTIAPDSTDAGGQADRQFPWRLALALLVLLILVGLALAPALLRRTVTRRRWAAARSPRAAADAAWTEVRATAVDLDLAWSDHDTVRTNGQRVEREVPGATIEARDALREVVRFVELTRYARPQEMPADLRARLQADVATWQSELYGAVDPRRARRARWLPRSVWRGHRPKA